MFEYRIEMIDGSVMNIVTCRIISDKNSGLFKYDDTQYINLDYVKHIELTRRIKWEDE